MSTVEELGKALDRLFLEEVNLQKSRTDAQLFLEDSARQINVIKYKITKCQEEIQAKKIEEVKRLEQLRLEEESRRKILERKSASISEGSSSSTPHKRKAIPKKVRTDVWDALYKTIEGLCHCCGTTITVHNFHCGHILAQCKGGTDTLDNLRPLCASCNTSMSSTHMADFIREYKFTGPGAVEFAEKIVMEPCKQIIDLTQDNIVVTTSSLKGSGKAFIDDLCAGRVLIPHRQIITECPHSNVIAVYISVAHLYDLYVQWCKEGRVTIKSKPKFGEEINKGTRLADTSHIKVGSVGKTVLVRHISNKLWPFIMVDKGGGAGREVCTLFGYIDSIGFAY